MATVQEIIEAALKRLDPEREFRECLVLKLASELAPPYEKPSNNRGDDEKA